MRVLAVSLLAGYLLCTGGQVWGAVNEVRQHTIYEASLASVRDYDDPVRDARVTVTFFSPTGKTRTVDAFWDGGRTWRVRFSPDQIGEWTWRSECLGRGDSGLDGQSGRFVCVPYTGKNPLYLHGPIRLSQDGHRMMHADGTPFLFLADTAWNGVLKADPSDWKRYLADRSKKGFSAVQFVSTHWVAYEKDGLGETAYRGKRNIRINPDFFRRLDGKVAQINLEGLVACPVMLWARGGISPGVELSEEDAVLLARYIAARWGAYQVIWILGGDGEYAGGKCERWKRIGRAVFEGRHDRLVTIHPCGLSWVADEFRGEKWLDFITYQSGHSDAPGSLKWLTTGTPSRDWSRRPNRPVINLEPNYETHLAYESRQPFDAHKVRRALYWSLLISPTAGVTYGHHGIWPWSQKREIPLNHSNTGEALPWYEALRSEGSVSVRHLRTLFDSIQWWKLEPDGDILGKQPGASDPARFVAAARSKDGDLAVLYIPVGGQIMLKTEKLCVPAQARWYNPRNGKWRSAGTFTGRELKVETPDDLDWVLVIRSQLSRQRGKL